MEEDIKEIKKELAELKELVSKLLVMKNKGLNGHAHKLPKYIPGGIGWIN
ncbi:MAG: hypothetical protein K1W33_06940 [Clostridia bacterium]